MIIITAHNIFKGVFFVFIILKKTVSKIWSEKMRYLYLKPILLAIFVTISTKKNLINARTLH